MTQRDLFNKWIDQTKKEMIQVLTVYSQPATFVCSNLYAHKAEQKLQIDAESWLVWVLG
jgi:hypothetical protein